MTIEQAKQEAEGRPVALRSCWKCNGAHEYLKEVDDYVILCYACQGYFYKGIEIIEGNPELEDS